MDRTIAELQVTDMREAVRASGLLGEGPVLVMLSGGRDSVCLLDVILSLRGAPAVSALHVNYGLRPQAGEDQRHCQALCEGLGVKLHVVRAPTHEQGPGNLQAWAREVRYEAAQTLAQPLGEDARIATGHTATDQVETILYRLAASPGRRALLGMSAREGRVIRPLLSITREQSTAYCQARHLAWSEDATNVSDLYARGRVRQGLVPALRSIHPAAEANVLRTAELLREETELLDGLVDTELAGQANISIERLAELPAALARLIVVRLAEDAAGTFVPQAGGRVADILALDRRGARAELHVGGLISAVVQSGRLSMVRIPAHYPSPKRAAEDPPEGARDRAAGDH
ncbi:MAG TPA: tRNA lysidine(34) synthetase TilS [Solirubrobacteraceae bacterium]